MGDVDMTDAEARPGEQEEQATTDGDVEMTDPGLENLDEKSTTTASTTTPTTTTTATTTSTTTDVTTTTNTATTASSPRQPRKSNRALVERIHLKRKNRRRRRKLCELTEDEIAGRDSSTGSPDDGQEGEDGTEGGRGLKRRHSQTASKTQAETAQDSLAAAGDASVGGPTSPAQQEPKRAKPASSSTPSSSTPRQSDSIMVPGECAPFQVDALYLETETPSAIEETFTGCTASLQEGCAAVVVTGESGSGKSWACAKYAADHAADYSRILWIDVCSLDSALLCFSQLVGGVVQAKTAVGIVCRELAENGGGEGRKPWLLVLDGVQGCATVEGLIPRCGGHVLISTATLTATSVQQGLSSRLPWLTVAGGVTAVPVPQTGACNFLAVFCGVQLDNSHTAAVGGQDGEAAEASGEAAGGSGEGAKSSDGARDRSGGASGDGGGESGGAAEAETGGDSVAAPSYGGSKATEAAASGNAVADQPENTHADSSKEGCAANEPSVVNTDAVTGKQIRALAEMSAGWPHAVRVIGVCINAAATIPAVGMPARHMAECLADQLLGVKAAEGVRAEKARAEALSVGLQLPATEGSRKLSCGGALGAVLSPAIDCLKQANPFAAALLRLVCVLAPLPVTCELLVSAVDASDPLCDLATELIHSIPGASLRDVVVAAVAAIVQGSLGTIVTNRNLLSVPHVVRHYVTVYSMSSFPSLSVDALAAAAAEGLRAEFNFSEGDTSTWLPSATIALHALSLASAHGIVFVNCSYDGAQFLRKAAWCVDSVLESTETAMRLNHLAGITSAAMEAMQAATMGGSGQFYGGASAPPASPPHDGSGSGGGGGGGGGEVVADMELDLTAEAGGPAGLTSSGTVVMSSAGDDADMGEDTIVLDDDEAEAVGGGGGSGVATEAGGDVIMGEAANSARTMRMMSANELRVALEASVASLDMLADLHGKGSRAVELAVRPLARKSLLLGSGEYVAFNLWGRLRDCLVHRTGELHVDVAEAYFQLGRLRLAANDHIRAYECFNKARRIYHELDMDCENERVRTTFLELGALEFRTRRRPDRALEYLQRGLSSAHLPMLADDKTIDAYDLLYNIFIERRMWMRAVAASQAGIAACLAVGDRKDDLARFYQQAAVGLSNVSRYIAATEYLNRAAALFDELYGIGNTRSHACLTSIENFKASKKSGLGATPEALYARARRKATKVTLQNLEIDEESSSE